MALYEIKIEMTSDWSSADIVDGAVWVKPEHGTITLDAAGSRLGHLEISDKRIMIRKEEMDTGKTTLHLMVQATEGLLEVDLAHGDNGQVSISSPYDTQVNNRLAGDGQNCWRFKLALTGPARAHVAAAKGAPK